MNADRWRVAVHELSPHTARVAFLPPGSDPPGPTFAVQQPPAPRAVPVQDRWAELCGGKLRVFVADDGRPLDWRRRNEEVKRLLRGQPLDQMPLLLRDGASLELGRPALRADQVMAGPRETPRSGKWI